MKYFKDEEIKDIILKYCELNMSLSKIGEEYSVSRGVITRILKENDIDTSNPRRKYRGDFDYFEKIDSPDKAYWLGFIAADGCVVPPRSDGGGACVKIRLHPKDEAHLIKLTRSLNSNLEIKHRINTGYSEGQSCVDLEINSSKMVKDLINCGVTPRKSLTLSKPNIDDKYAFDFIRGYFDGDGSIYKSNQNRNMFFSIVGTLELLSWVQKCLGISQSYEKRHKDDKNTYYIRMGGTTKVLSTLNKLYSNSPNMYLERKYQLFLEMTQSFIEETQ